MTNMKTLLSTLVVLVSVVLTGCRTPSAGIRVDSYPSTQITVGSKAFAKYLEVASYSATRRNDLLQVQLTVLSRTRRDVQFEYRYRWLNKAGMQVDSGTSTWIPASISAKEKVMLNAIAPNREVDDFVWDIRFVRFSDRW